MEAEAYLLAGQPVVLNNAMLTWPSSSWTPEFLSQQLSQPLSCKVTPLSVGKALMETECIQESVRLPDFVQWLRGHVNGDNPLQKYDRNTFSCYLDYKYMQEIFATIPELLKAVRWESVGLEGRDGAASTLWLGSEGAYTNCHYDAYGYNLVAQIYGRKRWVLFPPSDTKHLYPTRIPFEESSIFSQVDVKNPDLKLHPQVELTSVHEVILEPGQILYVPRHWWHYVECLEPAISINTWVELAVDNESRFEEAVTRSLFSSLWCSHINMERQGTDDCHQLGAETREWINPKEEIWDNSHNTIVLTEAFKAVKGDRSCGDACPRSDRGCDLNTLDPPGCATGNRHRERNLDIFAQHFRGKTVLFPNKCDSKRCVDQNHDNFSNLNQGECSNKSKKTYLHLQEEIPDTLYGEDENHKISTAQNLNRKDKMPDGLHLKRKHSGKVGLDQPCAAKICKLKPESSERLLGDHVSMKTISSPDPKSISNNVTVERPCCRTTCARYRDQDCDGQTYWSLAATPTQSEVSLTAVTAQPFMTWHSSCKCGNQNSDRDISRDVLGSKCGDKNSDRDISREELGGNSMLAQTQTQEHQSGSRVQNATLGSGCSCSKPDAGSDGSHYKQEMCGYCTCGNRTGELTNKSDTGETVNSRKLTFEKFVMCATHPDVIRTIARVIRNNMAND